MVRDALPLNLFMFEVMRWLGSHVVVFALRSFPKNNMPAMQRVARVLPLFEWQPEGAIKAVVNRGAEVLWGNEFGKGRGLQLLSHVLG